MWPFISRKFRNTAQSDNRFQLASVAKSVFDNGPTGHQDVFLRAHSCLRFNGEVYPTIAEDPATLLSELDNGAFGFQEEQVLGV